MVVRVFKAILNGIVVNIRHGKFGLDALEPERLKLEIRHGAGCVLRKGLVYFDADLRAGYRAPLDDVLVDHRLDCHG